MFAQMPINSSGDQGDSVTRQPSSHTEETVQEENSEEQPRPGVQLFSPIEYTGDQFIGLLNGSGLIPAESDTGLIFSAEVGGGWDSNPTGSSRSVSSSIYDINPYIAFHKVSTKSQFIVQYQPTFLGYSSGTYEGQTMHKASLRAGGGLSERLSWKMYIDSSYGTNGARFAAPLESVAVGEVPGTATGTASYLPDSGFVTQVFGSLETDYRNSERGTIGFDLSNSYSSISGFDLQGGAATAGLRYSYASSSTLSLMIYGQTSHFYGDLNCESVGAGAGVAWQLGIDTALVLEAGPQMNTGGCGLRQGYSYAVKGSTRLSNKAQFYLRANRLPMVSYLGPGTWQLDASIGMQYRMTRSALLRADIGYASSSALAAVSSYHGFSINTSYDVQLNHGFLLSYSYRGYFADSGGTRSSRNLAQVSLKWTTNSGKIFQSR